MYNTNVNTYKKITIKQIMKIRNKNLSITLLQMKRKILHLN